MASSSSGDLQPHSFQHGVAVLVNMYLSKEDPSILLRDFRCESPMQTYIVLNDKQGLGSDVSAWDRQSNTLGIVLIPCTSYPELVIPLSKYPRVGMCGVVLHLVADVSIPPDFKELPLKCLTTFTSPDAKQLYM